MSLSRSRSNTGSGLLTSALFFGRVLPSPLRLLGGGLVSSGVAAARLEGEDTGAEAGFRAGTPTWVVACDAAGAVDAAVAVRVEGSATAVMEGIGRPGEGVGSAAAAVVVQAPSGPERGSRWVVVPIGDRDGPSATRGRGCVVAVTGGRGSVVAFCRRRAVVVFGSGRGCVDVTAAGALRGSGAVSTALPPRGERTL